MPGELSIAEVAAAFDLRGRHALVTGAATGVGRAVALALATAGASVLAGHGEDPGDDEAVQILIRALKETGADHEVVRAELSTPDGVASLVESGLATAGLDIVVTTAPGADDRAALPELTHERWRATIDGRLTASLLVTRAAQPYLRGDASIVYIGSTVATRGEAETSAAAAAAAGLIGLTRSLAKELGPAGVRVNLIAPAPAVLGHEEHVAAVALYLASHEAGGISGEILTVDGGA